MFPRSRRDTKVHLTKPLLGSRRHCEAGTTMTIIVMIFHLLMGSSRLSLDGSRSTYAVFPRYPYLRHGHLCLTDSLGCGYKIPLLTIRVFSVGYRWLPLYDTW